MAQQIFQRNETGIIGCFELLPKIHSDERGRFVKVFQREAFEEEGLSSNYTEEFYSISQKNVIRGLHFQMPPLAHVKLVYCVNGTVQDAVVDIRSGSPTFGKSFVIELCATKGNILYIPVGLAHGFCSLTETATVVYKTSSSYSPACDAGILWNSTDIQWATIKPILSERDLTHPPLTQFNSPFIFEHEN